MSKIVKIVLGVVGAYVALMLITGLGIKMALSGTAADRVRSQLEANVPVPISFGEGEFDLVQWFLLQPAVSVADISVGNPEGFSGSSLLEAGEISLQVALLSLLGERLEIHSIVVREPVINVERNSGGRTNIEDLLDLMAQKKSAEPENSSEESRGKSLAIDSLFVEDGTVRYTDAALGPDVGALTLNEIDVEVLDFASDSSSRMDFQAVLFGGDNSSIRFNGRGGPFQSKSMPAEGELSVELAPVEIPPGLRNAYFGDLSREPTGDSRITLEADMQGDLVGALKGEGRINFSEFAVGESQEYALPLEGEAPLQLAVQRAISDPSLDLVIPEGSLTLGKGRWEGQAKISYAGSRVTGSSSGAINGVDINEMAGALASSEGTIAGLAAIPQYSLRFAGSDADQIRNSLAGTGNITLENGEIAIFNLLATIEKHANKLLGGETAESGETEFTSMSSKMEIKNAHLYLAEIVIDSPGADIIGNGHISFNKDLHFDLQTIVEGALAATLGAKPDSEGKTRASVPVRVRGTVDSPKVYPDIERIVTDRVKGLLDSLLNR